MTNCDYCVNYVYDDEYDCYTCLVNLDEDEMCRFITATTTTARISETMMNTNLQESSNAERKSYDKDTERRQIIYRKGCHCDG